MTDSGESRDTFDKVYARFRDDIERSARRQVVPGLDTDDVAAEMSCCLWEAIKTWRPAMDVTLGAYWWSIWNNRKVDIIRAALAVKRPRTVAVDDMTFLDRVERPEDRLFPPPGCSPEEEVIWELVGEGQTVKDVLNLAGISRRKFYSTLRKWRDDDAVRDYLVG